MLNMLIDRYGMDDKRIIYDSLNKFVHTQRIIPVGVNLREHHLSPLLWRALLQWDHLIHRPEYTQKFISRDHAIAVVVIELEYPAKLLLYGATVEYAHAYGELPKIQFAVAIGVERFEDRLGELHGVAVRVV